MKQYWVPECHEETGQTVLKLEEVGVTHPAHSPVYPLVGLMQKPDRMWQMTVNHWELHELTLVLCEEGPALQSWWIISP